MTKLRRLKFSKETLRILAEPIDVPGQVAVSCRRTNCDACELLSSLAC
jgi:hypothetical protein